MCGWKHGNTRKRRREDDDEDNFDQDSGDFYGFLADSFICDPQQQAAVEVGSSLSNLSTNGKSLSQHLSGNGLSAIEIDLSSNSLLPSSGKYTPMNANECDRRGSRGDGAFEVPSHNGSSAPLDQRKHDRIEELSGYRAEYQTRRSRRAKRQKKNNDFYYY